MKIHFIYPDINTWVYPTVHHGLASISAVLKKSGHKVSLQHIKKEPSRQAFLKGLKFENPDIVCFSSTTNQHPYVEKFAKWIKQDRNITIVSGGIHPTLLPDEVIKSPHIDMLCRGEGEYALLELCDNFKNRDLIRDIENLWVKDGDKIIKNPIRNLADVNRLPFPDYDIFDEKVVRWKGIINVIAGRGCPYDCSYCCNHALKEIFNEKGSYVRFREIGSIIEQIKVLVKRYEPKKILFEDDTFTLRKNWLLEFCKKYREEFTIPFVCNGRVDTIDEEILDALAGANCCQINYGLESGNERVRREVLNRQISNDKIKYVLRKTKEKNIAVFTYNMIGIPFESAADIEDTIELNKSVKPDHMQVFYFYPYPKTRLYKICEENNFLTSKYSSSYCETSTLRLPLISASELKKKYDIFSGMSIETEIKSRYPYFTVIIKAMNNLLGGARTRKIITKIYRNI